MGEQPRYCQFYTPFQLFLPLLCSSITTQSNRYDDHWPSSQDTTTLGSDAAPGGLLLLYNSGEPFQNCGGLPMHLMPAMKVEYKMKLYFTNMYKGNESHDISQILFLRYIGKESGQIISNSNHNF